MRYTGKNIQVQAFRANTMYELGEMIAEHIDNWNNNYWYIN